jgi:desulfoferrodoxin (superoxide reductase-like protein)
MRIFFAALAILVTVPLHAHPPKSVELDFDFDSRILTVKVTHNVNDATKHYVNKIVVEVDGNEKIVQTSTRQMDNQGHQATYKIVDVEQGDKISVTAYCNISGRKKVDLAVNKETVEEGGE